MMNLSTERALETIDAMRRQEECHGYYHSVSDYLSELPSDDSTKTSSVLVDKKPAVDATCRLIMSRWCNDVADVCHYKKETVAIAMNCLDRFMSSPLGQSEIRLDRDLYQLAVMTALYSSVKIHENKAMNSNLMSILSRGEHTAAAVEAMELKLLHAIQWKVNPPTAMSFVRLIIHDIVPDDLLNRHEKETILDLVKFQIEMTIHEYDFSMYDGSMIAFACMLNAIESCYGEGAIFSNFEVAIGNILSTNNKTIRNYLRVALYELVNDNDDTYVPQDMIKKKVVVTNNIEPFPSAGATTNSISTSNMHPSPHTVATIVSHS